jgi:predicted MPP superfamily phosphohydrolase
VLNVNDADLMWDILNIPPSANEFKRYRMTHSDTWLTQHREVLHMKHMNIGHIVNCMNMLEELKQDTTRAYIGLANELNGRIKPK